MDCSEVADLTDHLFGKRVHLTVFTLVAESFVIAVEFGRTWQLTIHNAWSWVKGIFLGCRHFLVLHLGRAVEAWSASRHGSGHGCSRHGRSQHNSVGSGRSWHGCFQEISGLWSVVKSRHHCSLRGRF